MNVIDAKCTKDEGNFRKLKEDPQALLDLVDKHVKVQIIKNTSFIGFVHSIDPVSFSIILSVPQVDDVCQIFLIPGHAVLDISEMEQIILVSPPPRKQRTINSSEELTARKYRLMSWLKLNLLKVEEEGENIIFGSARLLPPYTSCDICTDNMMVVMQMKKIIEDMPNDFVAT